MEGLGPRYVKRCRVQQFDKGSSSVTTNTSARSRSS
jgi:hypothetical protein